MSKALLYAANTSTQAYVATGTVINFGNVVRRYGSNINLSGGNISVNGSGYYNIDAHFTFNGAAGTATIQLYKDGVAIPGAVATQVESATGTYAVTIPAVIREVCCCESTITAVISGVAGNVTNAAIVVEKA